jgi:plastocyanin
MDRRTFLAAAGTGLSVGLAGCVGGSAGPAAEFDVGMRARAYDPETITVTAGETVRWKNTSSIAHTVTARAGGIPGEATFFASGGYETQDDAEEAWREGNGGAIYQGQTYEHDFPIPGEYVYYCIPHEAAGMAGVVTVEEGES